MEDEQHQRQQISLTVNTVFGTLALMYPNRFLKGLNDLELSATTKLWSRQLHGYPSSKIEQALDLVPDNFPTYPPTVGEFKKILANLNTVKPQFAPVTDHQRLEKLKTPEVGNAALDEMKNLLKKVKV